MDLFGRKAALLFDERVADLLRAMLAIADRTNDAFNLDRMGSVNIKLEIYTYLFAVVDYYLVANNCTQKTREEINSIFDEMFRRSKHWSQLPITDMGAYIDDRLSNYTSILKKNGGINETYFGDILKYQTQLIAHVVKDGKPIMGFLAIPDVQGHHHPLELDATLTFKVVALLKVAAVSIVPFINELSKNTVEDYFRNANYTSH